MPPFLRIGQDDNFVFPIVLKNTNLVEEVEILLSVKFRCILLSGFRGEDENVSANQRLGRQSCFSNQLKEKHKRGRGRWDLASCKVSLNSVQQLQRRRQKSQPIRGRGGHLVIPISPKNTHLVKHVEILLHVKFLWILFSCGRGEVENVSANQRLGWPSCFFERSEKRKLGRVRWDLASCQVSLDSVSAIS